MCATFTDDDVGKTVVNENGDEVGIVSAVEHGTARIEPDPGLADKFKAKLGWEGTDEDTYPLQEHSVSRVTDDEIHLEQDLAGVTEADAGTGVGTDAGRDSGVTDDSGIGDDDRGITDDDDDLIGDDDDDLIGDDDRRSDDDLIGDDDDDLIGDDDRRSDDDDLIGDDDDRRSDDDDDLLDDDDDDGIL